MTGHPLPGPRGVPPRAQWSPLLRGRQGECAALDRLIRQVAVGQSAVRVLRGEAGAGKTALLEYVAERAAECRVVRAVGVQSEMELAYSGLHQLCTGMLDGIDALPGPQRAALRVAFGVEEGGAPDHFAVGLAALGLLSAAAEAKPLVCLVDDAQWLDRASAQALAFVARRLRAERIAMIFAVREPGSVPELTGLPELAVRGLPDAEARLLLASVIPGRLDERVRDRIIAETRGNPLALLELPRGMTPADLAGGFGLPGTAPDPLGPPGSRSGAPPDPPGAPSDPLELPGATPRSRTSSDPLGPPGAASLAGRIEEVFAGRVAALPDASRQLILLAAAEPLGDVTLLWRAARRLGLGPDAAAPAETAGLVEFGVRVRFRHPLVRSAAYRAATPDERRTAHRALAAAIDGDANPDRRAWHRAHATAGLDEPVAAELEHSAARAQGRGGVAAAAAFLQRAAELTPDPARRGARALAGAEAKLEAAAPEAASALLDLADLSPLDAYQRARARRLRARYAFALSRGSDALPPLLDAAKALAGFGTDLARDTYLEAFTAAISAGRLGDQREVRQAAEAALAAPSWPPGPVTTLVRALATVFVDGFAAAVPSLRTALEAFRGVDGDAAGVDRWLWLACRVASDLWDDRLWDELAGRGVELAREAGALGILPIAAGYRAGAHLHNGEFAAAAALMEEATAVTQTTGTAPMIYTTPMLAAYQGDEAEAVPLLDAAHRDATARGQGLALSMIGCARAVLGNGLARYDEAVTAAVPAAAEDGLGLYSPALVELVEAAVRSDRRELAESALARLTERTRASGTDWALGMEARSRALLAGGPAAEAAYEEAVARLTGGRVDLHLARARLVYGEWLRRENRRLDARRELAAAHEGFERFGAAAFAERARRELLATGETARRRTPDTLSLLTPQEAEIARLAGAGLTNPEIAAQLFISPRTVEYHLRKVFPKLNIGSRKELRNALGGVTGEPDQGA